MRHRVLLLPLSFSVCVLLPHIMHEFLAAWNLLFLLSAADRYYTAVNEMVFLCSS